MIEYSDFTELDMRVGRVERAEPFPEARNPAYRLWIDFGGELGTMQSSAQITDRYEPGDLEGRQVVAVVNLPPKQIAGFRSEVLVLGVPSGEDEVVLLGPDDPVPPGGRVY